jgi:hypothetical protein
MYDEYPSWECIDSKKENTDPEDLYIDRCRGVKKRHMKDSGKESRLVRGLSGVVSNLKSLQNLKIYKLRWSI